MSESLLGKVIAAAEALTQTVEQQTSKINQAAAAATKVVRETIRGYNVESFFVDAENGDNSNSGKSGNQAWKDLSPLSDLIVFGKTYDIYLRSGQRVIMPKNIKADNVIITIKGDYVAPATLAMAAIDYNGTKDGTVCFDGHNQVLKLYGTILETATLPPESTGKSSSYAGSAFQRVHGWGNLSVEIYRGGIDIKDFPLIKTAKQNSGFISLNLGASSFIRISEGGESKLAYSNDHFGLSNGSLSFIDNAHGSNTWNTILSGVGGNSNVLADFDFEGQVEA